MSEKLKAGKANQNTIKDYINKLDDFDKSLLTKINKAKTGDNLEAIKELKKQTTIKKNDMTVITKHIKVVEKFGGQAILTSKKHSNGTERICEVAKKFKTQLVIDIQCDEIFLKPNHVDKLIDFHKKNKNFDLYINFLIILSFINF